MRREVFLLITDDFREKHDGERAFCWHERLARMSFVPGTVKEAFCVD